MNVYFHLFVYLISFSSVLVHKSFTFFDKFIPNYFILFGAIVNGIVSLIFLSYCPLLVYRNATDFMY